jgi:hypothetical protein
LSEEGSHSHALRGIKIRAEQLRKIGDLKEMLGHTKSLMSLFAYATTSPGS